MKSKYDMTSTVAIEEFSLHKERYDMITIYSFEYVTNQKESITFLEKVLIEDL